MTMSCFLNMYSFLMYWCCNRSFWWAFPFVETSAVWKVKCCIWRRCPSLYFKTKWRFTKRDLLQDNLISFIFCHISACHHFRMLTLTSTSVLSWMLDFYWGYWRLSCELHHTPHRFQIFFYFIKLQHFDVSISCHSTTMNILSICIFDVRSNVFKVSL